VEGLHCVPLQLGPAQSGRPLRGARASECKVNMVSHAEKACLADWLPWNPLVCPSLARTARPPPPIIPLRLSPVCLKRGPQLNIDPQQV